MTYNAVSGDISDGGWCHRVSLPLRKAGQDSREMAAAMRYHYQGGRLARSKKGESSGEREREKERRGELFTHLNFEL